MDWKKKQGLKYIKSKATDLFLRRPILQHSFIFASKLIAPFRHQKV